MAKQHTDAIDSILLEARTACRNKITDPAVWKAFEASVRPHLNDLEQIARRGGLDTNGTDALRGTMSTLMAYQSAAMNNKPVGRAR